MSKCPVHQIFLFKNMQLIFKDIIYNYKRPPAINECISVFTNENTFYIVEEAVQQKEKNLH